MVSNLRVNFIFLLFLSLFVLILINLFRIQVINHEDYVKRADKQFKKRVELPANRGIIYDVNKEKLAYNERSYDVKLELTPFYEIKDSVSLYIKVLSKALNIPNDVLSSRLNNSKKRKLHTIVLKRKLSENVWVHLNEKEIPGLYADVKQSRSYHKLGNNLIGVTDVDNKGVAGIEHQYNTILSGENGFQFVQKDGKGNRFSHVDYITKKPEDGKHIQLTIDAYHQSILEKELEYGMKKYNPTSISGIILDPFSGEIKAMASFPKYEEDDSENIRMSRNRVITDAYEPGSTFKMIVASAAIEEGIFSSNDLIFCENGRYRYKSHTYRDDTHKYGYLTVKQIIEKSSNIGSIKIAEKLGEHSLFRYVRDFGFGSKAEIGLDGETQGILHKPENGDPLYLSGMSIGHGIATSQIQIAQAYSVIANGGILVRPMIVKSVFSDNDEVSEIFEKNQIRRVISENTADTIKSFLKSVVKRGTAKGLYNKNLAIAGKTGTAQKFNMATKSFDRSGGVYASFAGFFPYDNPKYVCVISVDKPNYKGGNYGSTTAAPIFKRIALNLMNTVEKEGFGEYLTTNESFVFVPDLVGMKKIDAEKILSRKKLAYDFTGKGRFVVSQTPKKGLYSTDEVSRIDLNLAEPKEKIMPNLVGLTIREAVFKLNHFRINIKIKGSGIVKKQSIKPKTNVTNESEFILICE